MDRFYAKLEQHFCLLDFFASKQFDHRHLKVDMRLPWVYLLSYKLQLYLCLVDLFLYRQKDQLLAKFHSTKKLVEVNSVLYTRVVGNSNMLQ